MEGDQVTHVSHQCLCMQAVQLARAMLRTGCALPARWGLSLQPVPVAVVAAQQASPPGTQGQHQQQPVVGQWWARLSAHGLWYQVDSCCGDPLHDMLDLCLGMWLMARGLWCVGEAEHWTCEEGWRCQLNMWHG